MKFTYIFETATAAPSLQIIHFFLGRLGFFSGVNLLLVSGSVICLEFTSQLATY